MPITFMDLGAAVAPATSYSNPGGTGARTSLITATSSFVSPNGTAPRTVDGSFVGNAGGAIQIPLGAIAGLRLTWDFSPIDGQPRYFTKTKAYNNTNYNGEVGHYEYWDGSAWQVASVDFPLNSGTVETTLTLPAEGTLKLSWLGVSGSTVFTLYWTEQEFEISA